MIADAGIRTHLEAIPDRVARGHRWLADIDPLGQARVLPEQIMMWSNRWCVLGQYAHAAGFTGVNAPYKLLEALGVDPDDTGWLQDRGFACPIGWEHHASFASLAAYYEQLRAAWVHALTHERTLALDTVPPPR